MAASAWVIYNSAKEYIGDNTIDLDDHAFFMGLYTSASNADTATLSTQGSVSNEVASANGYTVDGQSLAGVTWASGASASERRFDATANVWSASGGSISAIAFAVIYDRSSTGATSAGDSKLLCYSQLTSAQFSISSGNTLTVTPASTGIFELN